MRNIARNFAQMRALRLSAMLIGLAALVPTPARAVYTCDGCVVTAVEAAATAITGAIVTLQERLVRAVHGNAATITAEQAKAAELVAESNQRTQSNMEQIRQEDRYKLPDACALLAASRPGAQDAPRVSGGLGGGAGRGGASFNGGSRTSDNMKKANDIAARRTAAPSPEAQASLAASGACNSYATGGSVRGKSCELAGFSANASSGYPDADIRADTLFDGPQTGSGAAFRRNLSISADGDERSALESYLRNLNTPVDLRELKKAEMVTDAGRQYRAFRDTYEARMSVAEKPARMLVADRIATTSLKPTLDQLLQSTVSRAFVQNYLTRNAPDWATKGISVDELITLEAERRYSNRDWHLNMASLPPEAHVKEQTTMMAYQVFLLSRIYERLGVQAVLQGQVVATAVRSEMLPQLMSLHSAASK